MQTTGTNTGQSGLDLSQELAAIISEDERELDGSHGKTGGQGERDDPTAGGSSGSCAIRPRSPVGADRGALESAGPAAPGDATGIPNSKRARREDEQPPPTTQQRPPGMVRALACVRSTFGAQWQTALNESHTLVYAHPVLYCSRCGHHAMSMQHATSLKGMCHGAPKKGSPMLYRLRDLRDRERHPITKERLERAFTVRGGVR